MSAERPNWRAVHTSYGSSFVRDIEFPERDLRGRYTKTLNRRGGLRFEELLFSRQYNVVRNLEADMNEHGKVTDKDIALYWSGRVRDPLALDKPWHNPLQEASLHILGIGSIRSENEIWMVNRRTRSGSLTLDYLKSNGKISSMIYEPATVDFGIDRNIDREAEFVMDPRGSMHALSSLFFDNGGGIFTLYEGGHPTPRQIELSQRGWTDLQREHFNMALDDVLTSKAAEGFLDQRLSQEQRTNFVESLKRLVSGGFEQKSFPENVDYIKLRHAVEEDLELSVAQVLEINAFDQQVSATPEFDFYNPTANHISIEVKSKEDDEPLLKYDLPYGEDFRYDRFVLNFSRSEGRLLMAVNRLGRASQKEWFFIPEEVAVADVEKMLKASQAERWAQSIRFVPAFFTDQALALVPDAKNPHAGLMRIWTDPKVADTERGQVAKEHVDNCPHCKVNVTATTSLLRRIFGNPDRLN